MKFGAKVFLSLLLLLFVRISTFAQAQNPTRVSCPEAAQYYSKDSINIVTFGASTVEGVNGLGFQTMLQNNFSNCYTNKLIDITNHGIGGQTTFQGLLRIDNAIANSRNRSQYACIYYREFKTEIGTYIMYPSIC
jgi:acyl-CoA thioesterase-1